MNSIKNKYDTLTSMIKDNIDVLMVLETKPILLSPMPNLSLKDMPLHLGMTKTVMVVKFFYSQKKIYTHKDVENNIYKQF